jgi:hypothetical protein
VPGHIERGERSGSGRAPCGAPRGEAFATKADVSTRVSMPNKSRHRLATTTTMRPSSCLYEAAEDPEGVVIRVRTNASTVGVSGVLKALRLGAADAPLLFCL